MNKLLIATMIASLSTVAFAEGRDSRTGGAIAAQQQQQASVSGASTQGNITYYEAADIPANTTAAINTRQSGTATLKTVATVYAPALTSSNDTCMGSTSFGATGIGFGVSIGSSWTDANCVMLKNAREMYNMGMPEVAFARLCMDELNREAIELTGKLCPQTVKAQKAAQTAEVK